MDISVGSTEQITQHNVPGINKSNYALPKDVSTVHPISTDYSTRYSNNYSPASEKTSKPDYALPKDVNTISPTAPECPTPFNQDIDVGKRKKYKCIRPPKLIQIDKTLTKQNYAADAATVGALINDLNNELSDISVYLQLVIERIGDVNVVELKE